jgi:ribosomal protein L5
MNSYIKKNILKNSLNRMYLKFNYTNVYEIPKIKKISLSIKTINKETNIIFYSIFLIVLSNQQINLKKLNKINKKLINLTVDLNKKNSLNFLFNFIYLYLPQIKNLNKFNTNFFYKGVFSYNYIFNLTNLYLHELNSSIFDIYYLLKKKINIKIISTTTNNKTSLFLLNSLNLPIYLINKTN